MDHDEMMPARVRALGRPIPLAVVVLFAALLAPIDLAFADDDEDAPANATDPERARALFKEGRQLAASARYHEACDKFEESLRFDAGIGTQFNLADCFEHIGRTASAHTLFARVTDAAARTGQQDRSQLARQRAVVLEPKLTRLVIKSEAPTTNLALSRDGKPIGGALGHPFAVDPGPHDIEARWPDNRKWSVRLDVPATAGTVTVIIPNPEDWDGSAATRTTREAVAQPAAVDAVDAPQGAAQPKDVARVDARSTTTPGADLVSAPPIPETPGDPILRKAAFVFGTVGIAALAGSGWMFLRYRSNNNDASDICPTSRNCTTAQIEEHDRLVGDARSALRWTYVGLGAGGAALIGATVAYLRGRPDGSSTESNVAATPVATPGAFGFVLRGRW